MFFGGIVSTGAAVLRKQMADTGLGRVAYSSAATASASPEFIPLAGAAADGTYFTLDRARCRPAAGRKGLSCGVPCAVRQRPRNAYSPGAYAAAEVALDAVRRVLAAHPTAEPSREDVLRAVATTRNLATPLGPVSFERGGDLVRPTISVVSRRGDADAIRLAEFVVP